MPWAARALAGDQKKSRPGDQLIVVAESGGLALGGVVIFEVGMTSPAHIEKFFGMGNQFS